MTDKIALAFELEGTVSLLIHESFLNEKHFNEYEYDEKPVAKLEVLSEDIRSGWGYVLNKTEKHFMLEHYPEENVEEWRYRDEKDVNIKPLLDFINCFKVEKKRREKEEIKNLVEIV